MTTVNKNQQQKTKEKLPKPPREGKSWGAKRVDNAMRALRGVKTLHERVEAGVFHEKRPEFTERAKSAYEATKLALAAVEQAVKAVNELASRSYEPEKASGGSAKLEVGANVWIRGAVWRRKFHGLYKPSEMDGLKVVALQGKLARAVSASGKEVLGPVGDFKTRPVDYEAAAEEGEEVAAA